MATFTLQIVFSFIFIAPRFMQCTNSSKVKCTHKYSRNTCYSHSYLISHALCCTYKMSKYWLKGPIKYEDTWKPVFRHKKHVNFQKGTPPGGLEPPTFRLTAERASRLRHGGCDDKPAWKTKIDFSVFICLEDFPNSIWFDLLKVIFRMFKFWK